MLAAYRFILYYFFLGISIPYIVPTEYRAQDQVIETAPLEDFKHPLTNRSRRFIVGDRFHSATNPHKSHLCKYHDINLCAQAHALKTSYQESENKRKNEKRLRSSCMQSFHTHYFYNYLMDFYQNEAIVSQQRNELAKASGKKAVRDRYLRFVV